MKKFIITILFLVSFFLPNVVLSGTYTPYHNFYKIDYGEGISTWWDDVNHNWDIVDKYLAKTVDAGQYASLNAAVSANPNKTILVTSTMPLNANLTVPAGCSIFVYKGGMINLGSYTITFSTSSSLTGGNYKIFDGATLISGITLGSGSVEYINGLWFGSIGDNSTNNTTALQAAINCAARSGIFKLYLPKGHYKFTKLYFEYDATLNPNYPSTNQLQTRVIFYGDGTIDRAAFDNAVYSGTILESTDATGPAIQSRSEYIRLGSGNWTNRDFKIRDMCFIANNTTQVVLWQGVHTGSGMENVTIIQKNASGGGFYFEDGWISNFDMLTVYNSSGASTGIGIRVYNPTIGAGLQEFKQCTSDSFNKNWVLGHLTYNSANPITNGITLIDCQGINGDINFELGNGLKTVELINVHTEAATTAGIWMRYRPGSIRMTGYSNCPDATEADIVIGDAAQSGLAREISSCIIENFTFAQVYKYGIKRSFASTGTRTLTINQCSFTAKTTNQGIGIDAYTVDFKTDIKNNNFSNLAVNIINNTPATVASATTVDLSGKGNMVYISGTANIQSITPPNGLMSGDRLTLIFTSTATLVDTGGTTAITTLTSSGYVATATRVAHGLVTGDGVVIGGATQTEYNRYTTITKIDNDTFTYLFPTSATTPATGSPTFVYGNLKLDGNFSATADDAVRLVWTGTWWYKDSSSVN